MITIAVTGGIGAGKSETIDILRKLGASTVSADKLGHVAYAKGTPGHADMIKAFGNKIIGEDGEIDRQSVGAIVFNDETKRKTLELIVWHRIREMLEGVISQNRDNHTNVTAIEAAVLFEAGWDDLVDHVWTVESSYHQRLARIVEKTGMDERAARKRMDAQLAPEIRIERADETIFNDGDLAALEQSVTKLWKATTKT
ncbi:MAG: dephospho-CoA kinase [Chloroflexi bacterium]|nr:dephospho-CoA kinase [Chloroflexota bacterium]